jgi:hypothetical protein
MAECNKGGNSMKSYLKTPKMLHRALQNKRCGSFMNEKATFKVVLKRYLNTHSFY